MIWLAGDKFDLEAQSLHWGKALELALRSNAQEMHYSESNPSRLGTPFWFAGEPWGDEQEPYNSPEPTPLLERQEVVALLCSLAWGS